jgi:TolA-binding protein
MNTDLQMETLLDDFLKNNISRTEAETILKKEGFVDPGNIIDLHLAAAKALQRYNIMQQVQAVHTGYIATTQQQNNKELPQKEQGKVVRMQPLKWATRIAATLILIAGGWFVFQYAATNSNVLYGEIYQSYNVNTDRGAPETGTHDMIQQFKVKDYAAVLRTFESLPVSNNREKFLAAYAALETADTKKAIDLFTRILDYNRSNNSRLYNDEAEFYLGLAYLKAKENKSARTIFENIRSNPNHTFHERVNKWTMTRLTWLH